MRRGLALALGLALSGCGYEVGRGAADPRGPFAVIATPGGSAHASAELAALAGARDELARRGALASSADATLAIEIVSVEELGEAPEVIGGRPLARATRVVVSGRARLRLAGRSDEEVALTRGAALVARGADPSTDALAVERARELAARELGARLARGLLGVPDPELP